MARTTLPIPSLSDSDKERFFAKISTVPTNTGCLEWTACKDAKGYGRIKIGKNSFQATRIVYFLSHGVDPGELCVLHHCDNPPCCRPECLWIGTDEDNSRDKIAKGREARGDKNGRRTMPERTARGEATGSAKLTESDIRCIRADTRTHRVIAADYGMDHSVIGDIKRGQIWKHVPSDNNKPPEVGASN